MKTYQYYWQLIRFQPLYYFSDIFSISVHFAVTTALGLILRAFFNYLTGEPGFGLPLGPIIGLQFAYALVSGVSLAVAGLVYINFEFHAYALLIRNMFARVLQMPGSQPLPKDKTGARLSTGQAISTFRDDTHELLMAIVIVDDVLGALIMAGISIAIMWQISPLITLGTFVPLALVIFIAQRLGEVAKRYRQASRLATSHVTGMIADMFHGTQAIKVANAETRIIGRFRALNDQRQAAMVKDKLLTQLVDSLSGSTIDMGMGLILLLAARAMYSGQFTLGDFALFAAYIWPTTQLMRLGGNVITRYKQASVSTQRMETMMQGAPVGQVVAHHPIYMDGRVPPITVRHKTAVHALQTLTIRHLTYQHANSQNGIFNMNLTLHRGSFTVITGRIGSGKTTLLKVLLGLLPAQSGEICWNHQRVSDQATFFVPPRCAYTSQVPRLFSDTVRNNILLGHPEDNLQWAIETAVLDKDIAQMDKGLETVVGPRGQRLSGGQIQRTAAARMFVRDPELLIFDDLSSALDVETEQQLWHRLFSQDVTGRTLTCLVVSHRRAALRRADHVIVMQDGRIADEGTLDELLTRNEEMQQIWHGDNQKG